MHPFPLFHLFSLRVMKTFLLDCVSVSEKSSHFHHIMVQWKGSMVRPGYQLGVSYLSACLPVSLSVHPSVRSGLQMIWQKVASLYRTADELWVLVPQRWLHLSGFTAQLSHLCSRRCTLPPMVRLQQILVDFPLFILFLCLRLRDGRGFVGMVLLEKAATAIFRLNRIDSVWWTHGGPAQDCASGKMHTQIYCRVKKSER